MEHYLDFEESVAILQGKIEELRHMSNNDVDIAKEVGELQKKLTQKLERIYQKLTPWQKLQVARHPARPHFLDYAQNLFTDFIPLAGDRTFGEDKALIGGPASFMGTSVMIMGQERGCDTKTRVEHNFGMTRPEGYRKAVRLMELAHKFSLPVITFIDTSGAYPGKGAEERGQAEAIAKSIQKCLSIDVPIISVLIGEGGSGGAIAIAASDRVAMLEHAVYSVISPEGCASILWRDASKAEEAATALKITADDLLKLKVIDTIIKEPTGGAHRHKSVTMQNVSNFIASNLQDLAQQKNFAHERRAKYIRLTELSL